MAGLKVLSLNAGSSSLKFGFWQVERDERELWRGAAEGLGSDKSRLWLRSASAEVQSVERAVQLPDVAAAVTALFELCREQQLDAPDAIGHRVVHGGPKHCAPCRIDDALLSELRALIPWAPLHLPASLAGIDAAGRRYSGTPQVACFDTAFHRALPELAQRLPLPRALWDKGVRRYGFHGLSYEYLVTQLGAEARGCAVIAHLGNGSSLAALRDGKPFDTSMGFTPAGGVMMGTRTGDLDPGVLLYLQSACGYNASALERLVERESGLLGISGSSADVKRLLAERTTNMHAAQALESFCYSVRKQIGAYAAALGGLDTLVFTGGIGERAAWVREQICGPLGFLGVQLDRDANARHAERISSPDGACVVRVVPTDEDRMIARHTGALVQGRV